MEGLEEQFSDHIDMYDFVIINGTIYGYDESSYDQCSERLGRVESFVVVYLPPVVIFLAVAMTGTGVIPLAYLSQQYFLPYVYLLLLSAINFVICIHQTFRWLDLLIFPRVMQRWRDSSLITCQTFHFVESVIQHFQNWLIVAFFVVIYAMKVSYYYINNTNVLLQNTQ